MTRKETLKNEIVMKMRYHLGKNELAMLDETLSECLYQVEIVDATTLPETFENSNEYILELYESMNEESQAILYGKARELIREQRLEEKSGNREIQKAN